MTKAEAFALDVQLETILLTCRYWRKFDADGRAREGLTVNDDTFIIAPPHWPSHGVLKAWEDCLQRAREALSASEGRDEGEQSDVRVSQKDPS